VRILSKFHDYYDTALGHGLDPDRLYSRAPRRLRLEPRFWPGSPAVIPTSKFNWSQRGARSLTLGFCGQHYPLWMPFDWPFDEESLTAHIREASCLTLEEAIEAQVAADEDREDSRRYRKHWADQLRVRMKDHDRRVREAPEDARPFRFLQSPVYAMIAYGGSWYHEAGELDIVTNPRLVNLGFERTLDAYSAFQEIAVFLANELARPDDAPLTTGGDDVVARSKGFDEASFRNAKPGQKKLNRQANRLRKRAR
jgi:hypothetical protein